MRLRCLILRLRFMMTLLLPTVFNGPTIIAQLVDIRLFLTTRGLPLLGLRLQAVRRRLIMGQRALVMMGLSMRDVRTGGSRPRERRSCLTCYSPQLHASVSGQSSTTATEVVIGIIRSLLTSNLSHRTNGETHRQPRLRRRRPRACMAPSRPPLEPTAPRLHGHLPPGLHAGHGFRRPLLLPHPAERHLLRRSKVQPSPRAP